MSDSTDNTILNSERFYLNLKHLIKYVNTVPLYNTNQFKYLGSSRLI